MAKNKEDNNTLIFLLLGAGILFFLFRKKPTPPPQIEQILKDAFNNLNFEYNKAVIKTESYNSLNELGNVLIQKPEWKLILSGYTDNKGSDSYNLKLSQDRANAVKEYLIAQGINENRISAKGYGSSNPIAPNDTDENRAKNRRVEFKILKNI
jgi:outer membrane protein OmpA-like peptidoglycan-associated protein